MFTSIQYDLTPKIAAIATLLLGLATVALAAQGFLALREDKAKAKANPGRNERSRS
jgi:ABC-type spermidine/putrescine transport system permease subunit II